MNINKILTEIEMEPVAKLDLMAELIEEQIRLCEQELFDLANLDVFRLTIREIEIRSVKLKSLRLSLATWKNALQAVDNLY